MNVYTELYRKDFERVIRCDNSQVGFSAWIAVHNTCRGPALGGCRLWNYGSDEEALTDVLRLGQGMTYKNALARLPLGGGKSVVRVDLAKVDREALFEAIGDFVERLGGDYIIAEDVNSTVSDMAVIKRRTQHVATVGASGNPSPFTAYGVYCAIKAACRHKYGKAELAGLRVAIQGLGEVGRRLAEKLNEEGCKLVVADINTDNIHRLRGSGVVFDEVDPDTIYDADCDVFAPCAMGGVLNRRSIPRLKCTIIAGCANNQLLLEEDGSRLYRRGILYVPDYAANAGGVINISCEIGQVYDEHTAYIRTAEIERTVENILYQAEQRGISPHLVANLLAEELMHHEAAA